MALLNYRTRIAAEQTAAEIGRLLARGGASRVMTEYDSNGEVSALSFELMLGDKPLSFRLPTDWRPVQKVLASQKVPSNEVIARNVAWRITKDWVEAQLAIIQTQMVTTAQVFLPYALNASGETLYQQIARNPTLLLGGGDKND